jgi:hypothetical protein
MTKRTPKKFMHRKTVYISTAFITVMALLSFMLWPTLKTAAGPQVVVYKSPTCGCCTTWVSYLRNNGFNVSQIDTQNIKAVKLNKGVPQRLESCHTAIIDGYIVEGHVPVNAIRRMLKEKPAIKGIGVPGMPIGSPGMEQGTTKEPYDVLAILPDGSTTIYESYRN